MVPHCLQNKVQIPKSGPQGRPFQKLDTGPSSSHYSLLPWPTIHLLLPSPRNNYGSFFPSGSLPPPGTWRHILLPLHRPLLYPMISPLGGFPWTWPSLKHSGSWEHRAISSPHCPALWKQQFWSYLSFNPIGLARVQTLSKCLINACLINREVSVLFPQHAGSIRSGAVKMSESEVM